MSETELDKALNDLPLEMKLDYYREKAEIQADYIRIMEEKLRRIGVAFDAFQKYKVAHKRCTKDRALSILGYYGDAEL